MIDAAQAFPGWTAGRVGFPAPDSLVNYNNIGSGGAAIGLYDQADFGLVIPLLEGEFDAILATGSPSSPQVYLSQTGDIPADAKSIRLLGASRRGSPIVSVNGTIIPMLQLSGSDLPFEVAMYGGDISPFAGTTAELRFTSPVPPNGRIVAFDAVDFSPEIVPEPTGVLMLSVAAIALGRHRRRIGTR